MGKGRKPLLINGGDIFGRWTVIKEVVSLNSNRKFLCECSCENKTQKEVALCRLRSGSSTSCGCFHKEMMSLTFTKHGFSRHPIYKTYIDMKNRCYNKNHAEYKNYGGRGIKICKSWLVKRDHIGLKNFILWNSNLPTGKQWCKGLEIDREDNSGDYSPSNCRWVTKKVNLNNKRNNVYVEYKDKKYTITQFWEKYGKNKIKFTTFYDRIHNGWNLLDALNKPT
jgi:hypothetical protein